MTFHLPGYDSCVTSMNALSSATFETAAFILNSGNLSPTVSMVSLPPFASVLSSDGAYSNAWAPIGPIDYFQFDNRLNLLMRRTLSLPKHSHHLRQSDYFRKPPEEGDDGFPSTAARARAS